MERFGDVEVYGLFIVWRVPLISSEDFGDLDIDLTRLISVVAPSKHHTSLSSF